MVKYFGIVGLITLFILSSCSTERKLARKYVNHHAGNGILIIPAYDLYKDNLTISFDTNVKYNPAQFDSIAWAQSCFIKHISDSVFLTTFTNSLIKGLSAMKFEVYVDGSSDIFLSMPDPKWMIQIAQLQLNEEHKYEYQEVYNLESGRSYYKDTRLNQVSLESWFDVSRANSGNKQVLYLEAYCKDDFHFGLDINLMGGSLGMSGKRDSLEIKDIYAMADESGKKHAELLFDYFMNDYIRENLPPGIINREYYHFNRKGKKLQKGLKERFDVIN